MLIYQLSIFLIIVAVSGEDFDPNLDVLVPKKHMLENSRKASNYNKNKNHLVNQEGERKDSSCSKRSQKDDELPAFNSLDDPHPPTQQYQHQMDDQIIPKLDQSSFDKPELELPTHQDFDLSISEDHKLRKPNSLDLRSEVPDDDHSRRFDHSPIDPSDLAAELQDCLEKKLHQKKTNVVVVMPVLDKNQPPSNDANDNKYLLTFVQPQGNAHINAIEDDPLHLSKPDSNCNKDQQEDEKENIVAKGSAINMGNYVEKELTVLKKQIKQENKVEKFLRTGIADDILESDLNLEKLDGRRRNNLYEPLPLAEVVESPDDQKSTADQSSAADEPVSSEISGSDNSRSGFTDRRVCYACSTINNPSCQNPNRMTTVKYCAGSRNSCVKKTYETGGTSVLIRDCAASCNDNMLPVGIVPKYKTCDLCYDDLCNAAYSIKDQGFLILFLLSSWVVCKIIV